ncbi:site-specific integrase [Opitutaceae bacterium TAV4]|nr:site-specific integrase [Opitutaceae bacterium TAV4]RRK00529.1 site-specific integrase [Opitutaceae bacterium TAV3]
MKQGSAFVVTEFTNPSGQIVYRVYGRLNGQRVRKNFSTRKEAEAEKEVWEIRALQEETGIRAAATRLTDSQLQEAEAAFTRLKDAPKSPLFYVDYALANYREPQHQKALTEAVAEYLASKQRDQERTLISLRQVLSIKYELKCLLKHFPKDTASQITAARLLPYLERGKANLKTYNNRRGIVSTLFKFALQKEWVLSNPMEKTPHHRINHRRGSAVTITAEKAAALMEYVETYDSGKLVPYFATCLFAGVRPCIRYGEITKLKAESVKLDTGVIRIEPDVSKVRMPRLITIQPNLAAWLRAYPLTKFAIVPPNATNTRRPVFARFDLTPDVLRHTFISMFVAKFRSMGDAALQAGNSESIIRKHYLDLKSAAEAEQFFGILPKHATESDSPLPVAA